MDGGERADAGVVPRGQVAERGARREGAGQPAVDGAAARILAAVVTRIASEDAAEDGTGFRGAGAPPRVRRSEPSACAVCALERGWRERYRV